MKESMMSDTCCFQCSAESTNCRGQSRTAGRGFREASGQTHGLTATVTREDHGVEDVQGANDMDAPGGMERCERRQGVNNHSSHSLNNNEVHMPLYSTLTAEGTQDLR